MEFTAVLAWLTVGVGFPVSTLAALLSWKKVRQRPDLDVLKERAVTASIIAVGVLFFGLIFVNNDQLIPPFDVDTTKIVTRSAMLVLGIVPALLWLRLYWKYGRRRKP